MKPEEKLAQELEQIKQFSWVESIEQLSPTKFRVLTKPIESYRRDKQVFKVDIDLKYQIRSNDHNCFKLSQGFCVGASETSRMFCWGYNQKFIENLNRLRQNYELGGLLTAFRSFVGQRDIVMDPERIKRMGVNLKKYGINEKEYE